MRYAILGDIHANLAALEAVLEGTGVFKAGEPRQWLKLKKLEVSKFLGALTAASDRPLAFLTAAGPSAVFSACAESLGLDVDRVTRRLGRKAEKRRAPEPVTEVQEAKSESEGEQVTKKAKKQMVTVTGSEDLRNLLMNDSQPLIHALASSDPVTREAGLNALASILERLEEAADTEERRFMFREVPQAALLMKLLKNTVPAPAEDESLPGPLPPANMRLCLLSPEHCLQTRASCVQAHSRIPHLETFH